MAPGLTQPQKLAHEGRIAQVHIRRPPVHSPTNVGLLPTLTPPSRLDPTGAWTGSPNGDGPGSDTMLN
uniref:Putative ovule protein n=2 Tax=Solanum chacoense TaxID=4108 RepID=A0A0V0GQB9_SOLCH